MGTESSEQIAGFSQGKYAAISLFYARLRSANLVKKLSQNFVWVVMICVAAVIEIMIIKIILLHYSQKGQ